MEQDERLAEKSGRPLPTPQTGHAEVHTPDRWPNRAVSPDDPNDALEYVQHAVDLKPGDPGVRASLLQAVEEKLARDPYVEYLAENSDNYFITFRNSRPIVVPKGRPPGELFPAVQRTESERTLGMIWWIVLGLVPAGLGALILSPIVMQRAFSIIEKGKAEPVEKRLAWLTILLAAGLGCLGELFVLLLVLHLIG